MEFISDIWDFHPSIFWVFKFTSFHNGKTTYWRIEFRENFTWRAPILRLVIIPYHPSFGWGRFNSYTPAVTVPIYKVTRVIKMLNFHQNADFREKIWITRISEFFDQLTPLLDHTFSDHLVKQQKTTRDKIRCKNSSCLIKA